MISFLKEYATDSKKALSTNSILNGYYKINIPDNNNLLSNLDINRLKFGSDQMFRNNHLKAENPKLLHNNLDEEFLLNRHWFGPHSIKYINKEKNRLLSIYNNIKSKGYRPIKYGAVKGYYIEYKSNKLFIIIGGHHRCAVLSSLNYKYVWTKYAFNRPKTVNIDTAKNNVTNCRDLDYDFILSWFDEFFDKNNLRYKPKVKSLLE